MTTGADATFSDDEVAECRWRWILPRLTGAAVADASAAEDAVAENPVVEDPSENPMGDAFLSEKTSPHQDTQNSAHKLADASITTAKVLFIVIISWVMGNRKTHAGHLPQ